MKRLLNSPDAVAAEALEGFATAFPRYVRKLDGYLGVVRRDAPVSGEIAVVTGGGSGHEPMFAGYVGPGMAHASVAGNIFASPPPQPIFETAKAAHSGSGILFVYGNYAGDVLNFDMAAEMLADDSIKVETVTITDDVASAPSDMRHERRGIAGDFFVIKVAGARAAERATLSEVKAAATKANDHTRSMGVALSSCTIPAVGRPIFEIGADEMELGLGIHGEPGEQRTKIMPADDVAGHLMLRILEDLGAKRGQELAVLINGLGNTPLSELFILNRAVARILHSSGLQVARTFVGNFASSLDMAGCSVTLMRLDDELKRWLLAAADTPAFVQR